MKAWLKDNLKVEVTYDATGSSDYDLQAKLGLNHRLPTSFYLSVSAYIDKELIVRQQATLPVSEYQQAFKCVANALEICIQQIKLLQQRIELLENPNTPPK